MIMCIYVYIYIYIYVVYNTILYNIMWYKEHAATEVSLQTEDAVNDRSNNIIIDNNNDN